MSKQYIMDMTRTTYFTVRVYADSPKEALKLAEAGQYEDVEAWETDEEVGQSYIDEFVS